MLHFVKKIDHVEPFRLHLKFNTGELRVIDLETKIREWSLSEGSKFKSLLNPDFFNSVKLDSELETVYWDNGIDLCPDSLYQWSSTV